MSSKEESVATADWKKTSGSNAIDLQMQQVLALMMARTRGQASSEQVETAVSGLLSETAIVPPASKVRSQSRQQVVDADEDEYDNLEEDAAPKVGTNKKPEQMKATDDVVWSGPKATIESMRQDDETVDCSNEDKLDRIPLGKSGGRMMVTFGDGRLPKPEAVEAALLGARQCLQIAVKDARALRRRAKIEYNRARATIKQGEKRMRRSDRAFIDDTGCREAVDPAMLFRAMEGYDKLSYEPKCGFDVQQLQELFPEEMNAYERWNKMHSAYQTSKKTEEGQEDATTTSTAPRVADSEQEASGGHLNERLANFDVRTEQMMDDWYLKFAEVRQGSFLPKRGKRSEEVKQWDNARKENKKLKRGRPAATWENLSAKAVQFLHWVGFDQISALPPPNEQTTEALAFLGYDFMGRIVEKAIYFKALEKRKTSIEEGENSDELLLELQRGEQLSLNDIEKAVNDSTVRPMPLYSATDDKAQLAAAQLYFGPGFEERIEMEMDELVAGNKTRISDAEMEIRRKEDDLFERLKAPPNIDNALNNLTETLMDEREEPCEQKEEAMS